MLSYFVGEKIRKCCAPHDRNRRQDTESKSGNFTVRKISFYLEHLCFVFKTGSSFTSWNERGFWVHLKAENADGQRDRWIFCNDLLYYLCRSQGSYLRPEGRQVRPAIRVGLVSPRLQRLRTEPPPGLQIQLYNWCIITIISPLFPSRYSHTRDWLVVPVAPN